MGHKMTRKYQSKQSKELHKDIMEELGQIDDATRQQRDIAMQDKRFAFVPGEMWTGDGMASFENVPKLEINRIEGRIWRIVSQFVNTSFTAVFRPASKETTVNDASVAQRLYDADKRRSEAFAAMETAFIEAAACGFGAYRLICEKEDDGDDDNEYQRQSWVAINDAIRCVRFSLDGQKKDKSDCGMVAVYTQISKAEYKRRYKQEPRSLPDYVDVSPEVGVLWNSRQGLNVNLAEVYMREEVEITRMKFAMATGVEVLPGAEDQEQYEYISYTKGMEDDDTAERIDELLAMGYVMKEEKKVKRPKYRKLIIDAGGILEDCGLIAGQSHGIVPVWGKRVVIDNTELSAGEVRYVKDPARLLNVQVSQMAELAAESPRTTPVFFAEQIVGHEEMWQSAPVKKPWALIINPMMDANGNKITQGPPYELKPSDIAPSVSALVAIMDQAIRDILGDPQNTERLVSNISEKTVEAIQMQSDEKAMIYISAMRDAERRAAEIWVERAREIYTDEGREIPVFDSEKAKEPDYIKIAQSKFNLETGQVEKEALLEKAKFDIRVEVGPTSRSAQQRLITNIMEIIGVIDDPKMKGALSAYAAMNMDGLTDEGLQKYIRQYLLRMGALEPTPEEAQQIAAEQQQANQNPESVYYRAAAEEAAARAIKVQAEIPKIMSDTRLNLAKAQQISEESSAKEIQSLATLAGSLSTVAQSQQIPAVDPQSIGLPPGLNQFGA